MHVSVGFNVVGITVGAKLGVAEGPVFGIAVSWRVVGATVGVTLELAVSAAVGAPVRGVVGFEPVSSGSSADCSGAGVVVVVRGASTGALVAGASVAGASVAGASVAGTSEVVVVEVSMEVDKP